MKAINSNDKKALSYLLWIISVSISNFWHNESIILKKYLSSRALKLIFRDRFQIWWCCNIVRFVLDNSTQCSICLKNFACLTRYDRWNQSVRVNFVFSILNINHLFDAFCFVSDYLETTIYIFSPTMILPEKKKRSRIWKSENLC